MEFMCQQTKNMFEHIIYEFYIYLASYEHISSYDIDIKNIAFECHVIHLRNLSYFFGEKKKHNCWHVSEVFTSTDSFPVLSVNFAKEINKYASWMTGHMEDNRLREHYKNSASAVFCKAFPEIKSAIEMFISTADASVRPELYSDWRDPDIQDQARHVLHLLSSIDNGRIRVLGQSSMMSVPTTSTFGQPAFAPVVPLSSQTNAMRNHSSSSCSTDTRHQSE